MSGKILISDNKIRSEPIKSDKKLFSERNLMSDKNLVSDKN